MDNTTTTHPNRIDEPLMSEPPTFARVLGVTDIPTEPMNGSTLRMPFCRELLKQAEALSVGKALMVEFETKRDREVSRVVLNRLIRYLDLPYQVKVTDALMWIYKVGASDGAK